MDIINEYIALAGQEYTKNMDIANGYIYLFGQEYIKAKQYVVNADELLPSEILGQLQLAFFNFLTCTYNLLGSFLTLCFYVTLVVLKFINAYFPGVYAATKSGATWVIDFHATHLSYTDMAIEAFVILSLLLYFIFKKRIHAAWKRFDTGVRKTSTAAADAAPHVLFFTCALAVSVLGQNILTVFASEKVLPIISLILPLLQTIRIVFYLPTGRGQAQFRSMLILWVIFAAYHSVATLLGIIPFGSFFLKLAAQIVTVFPSSNSLLTVPLIVFMKEFFAIILIWSQLSASFAEILFRWTSPVLDYLSSKLPSLDFGQAQLQNVLYSLKMFRMIKAEHEDGIRSLLKDGIASLVALLFIFTPIPSVGSVIIAMIFPAIKTISTINPTRWGSETAYEIIAFENRKRWLEYWICFGFIWTAKVYGISIWPIFLMPISLWLQHSYFQGARVTLVWIADVFKGLSNRNKKMRLERQIRQQNVTRVEVQTIIENSSSHSSPNRSPHESTTHTAAHGEPLPSTGPSPSIPSVPSAPPKLTPTMAGGKHSLDEADIWKSKSGDEFGGGHSVAAGEIIVTPEETVSFIDHAGVVANEMDAAGSGSGIRRRHTVAKETATPSGSE